VSEREVAVRIDERVLEVSNRGFRVLTEVSSWRIESLERWYFLESFGCRAFIDEAGRVGWDDSLSGFLQWVEVEGNVGGICTRQRSV
jgi:hypothetical protein